MSLAELSLIYFYPTKEGSNSNRIGSIKAEDCIYQLRSLHNNLELTSDQDSKQRVGDKTSGSIARSLNAPLLE